MKKRKLTLVISLIALVIMIGGGAMHLYSRHKQEELKRNREYEVSLVKALKNSYEGIEEIEISNPEYTSPPGSWKCMVSIQFKQGKTIKYKVNYVLDTQTVYDTSLEWENRKDDREYLNSKKGVTSDKINILYSNGEKGEQ